MSQKRPWCFSLNLQSLSRHQAASTSWGSAMTSTGISQFHWHPPHVYEPRRKIIYEYESRALRRDHYHRRDIEPIPPVGSAQKRRGNRGAPACTPSCLSLRRPLSLHRSGFQGAGVVGGHCLPGDIWQHLETCAVVSQWVEGRVSAGT